MINYSEDKDRQYHVQLEEGDVGIDAILTGDPKRCQRRLQNILKMLCP